MNNEEPGLRYNTGKPKWSLVDFQSLEPMVRVLEYGAKKYTTKERSGAHNWKYGLKYTEAMESLLRHAFAFLNGEDNDPESGLPHIGHIQANAMFVAYMMQNRPDMDDRTIISPAKASDIPGPFLDGKYAQIQLTKSCTCNYCPPNESKENDISRDNS
jgi:hypothetical protein